MAAEREEEERAALAAFCPGADLRVTVLKLPDGRLPAHWDQAKQAVEDLRALTCPTCPGAARRRRPPGPPRPPKLVPTAFRDHLVLGYEIVKWDGDLGRPTAFQPLARSIAEREGRLLEKHYPSQRDRTWFDREASSGWPGSAASNATPATPRRSTSQIHDRSGWRMNLCAFC